MAENLYAPTRKQYVHWTSKTTVATPVQCTPAHCFVCYKTLWDHLSGDYTDKSTWDHVPDVKCPFFVTWFTKASSTELEVRGSAGSLGPLSIRTNLPRYAIVAATQDTRYPPVTKEELLSGVLTVEVAFLDNLEHCSPLDWEIGRHGLNIKYDLNYSACYLPYVPQANGWDQRTTLSHLYRKAGLPDMDDTDDMLERTACLRFTATCSRMDHDAYHASFLKLTTK